MSKKTFLFITILFLSFNLTKADNPTNTIYTPEKLMEVADQQIGKEVKVRGTVTHVCKHSGKKCFIVSDDGKISLQIMAGGNITAFGKDLMGSEIEATGVVKERRMEKDVIDNNEKTANEKMQGTSDKKEHEHCEAMLNNVKEMRQWMKKNNKDYFAIYYIDGLKYEVVD